jgi:queuine/archaeosine tRNA-ribosyltransferase
MKNQKSLLKNKLRTSNNGAIFIPVYVGGMMKMFEEFCDLEIKNYVIQKEFKEKKSLRVFNKKSNPYFFYPWILIPANESFKKKKYRELIGANNSKVFVDSGGFSLAMGKTNPKVFTDKVALEWSENNGDIFPILDRPSWNTGIDKPFKTYEECLEKSIGSARYYYENRSNSNCEVLNVLQGETIHQMKKWYENIKQYEFDGWAVGGLVMLKGQKRLKRILDSISVLLETGELEKPNVKYIHFFGVSTLDAMIYLEYFQQKLNERKLEVQITYDSSTWNRGIVYGNYKIENPITGSNGNQSSNVLHQQTINITNKNIYQNMCDTARLPCDCPICINLIKPKDFFNWKTNGNGKKIQMIRFRNIFSFHNLYMTLKYIDKVRNVLNFNSMEFNKAIFGARVFGGLERIDRFFNKPTRTI